MSALNGTEKAHITEGIDASFPMSAHPLEGILGSEGLKVEVRKALFDLLLAVKVFMTSLPADSNLQRIALRCWSMKFQAEDHAFLHRSHIFSVVSNLVAELNNSESLLPAGIYVTEAKEVTSAMELKVSSQSAMVNSLTDNSTETFWESGDDDNNKTKWLQIHCKNPESRPDEVCVHIDNQRDPGQRTTKLQLQCGPSENLLEKCGEELSLSNDFAGWVTLQSDKTKSHVYHRVVITSAAQKVRLRQVRVFSGTQTNENWLTLSDLRKIRANETLKVFRDLTFEIFGKSLGEGGEEKDGKEKDGKDGDKDGKAAAAAGEHEPDLRQHVVGLLFGHGQSLNTLQTQVCEHIIKEVHKETARKMDKSDSDESNDAYCFELLSMLYSLSGSEAGVTFISKRAMVVNDLVSQLHVSTARSQRQIVAILRRVLAKSSPTKVDPLMNTSDTKLSFDGLLPHLLVVIGKAIGLQIRSQDKKDAVTVSMKDALAKSSDENLRRLLRSSVSLENASEVMKLVTEMADSSLSSDWAEGTKVKLRTIVSQLSKVEEELNDPQDSTTDLRVWLSLAALSVIDEATVGEMASASETTSVCS